MDKRKTKKQSAKATLAEVIREMDKPRMVKSAREYGSVFSERSFSREARCWEVNCELAKIRQLCGELESDWGAAVRLFTNRSSSQKHIGSNKQCACNYGGG
jgi:hypothetical protein